LLLFTKRSAFFFARGRPGNPARKMFFFEKKNQKTFVHDAPGAASRMLEDR
jgi:hypothetical protein